MGQDIMDSIRYSFLMSNPCYTWIHNNRPMMILGIGKPVAFEDFADIWIASTEETNNHKIAMIRNSKRIIGILQGTHQRIGSHIDARLKSTLKWVRFLDFHVGEAQPNRETGALFHYCYKDISTCHHQPQRQYL